LFPDACRAALGLRAILLDFEVLPTGRLRFTTLFSSVRAYLCSSVVARSVLRHWTVTYGVGLENFLILRLSLDKTWDGATLPPSMSASVSCGKKRRPRWYQLSIRLGGRSSPLPATSHVNSTTSLQSPPTGGVLRRTPSPRSAILDEPFAPPPPTTPPRLFSTAFLFKLLSAPTPQVFFKGVSFFPLPRELHGPPFRLQPPTKLAAWISKTTSPSILFSFSPQGLEVLSLSGLPPQRNRGLLEDLKNLRSLH